MWIYIVQYIQAHYPTPSSSYSQTYGAEEGGTSSVIDTWCVAELVGPDEGWRNAVAPPRREQVEESCEGWSSPQGLPQPAHRPLGGGEVVAEM